MLQTTNRTAMSPEEGRLLVAVLLFCATSVFAIERRDGSDNELWEPAHGLEQLGLLEWRACGAVASAGRRMLRVQYKLTAAGDAAARAML